MTFNEILAQVQLNVWGNTPPPANMTDMLTDTVIPNAHKRIQKDHNLGFMITWTEFVTAVGYTGRYNQAYTLPDGFKEIVAVQWQLTNDDGDDLGKSKPLAPVALGHAQEKYWPGDNIQTVEYPTSYEIINNTIVFYPEPNEVRTAIMTYFQFVDCPAGANDDWLLIYGDEAVIAKATAMVYKVMHDMNNYQLWEGIFADEEARLLSVDFAKRFTMFKEILPEDYSNLYE